MIPVLVSLLKTSCVGLVVLICIFLHCGFLNVESETPKQCGCVEILERREWRNLTIHDRAQYISAVQCLQSLPATSAFAAARTRFDDFQALHISLQPEVHVVGQFLPWHRRFIATFEKALRDECAYPGALPYWDWTLDHGVNKSIPTSPIFDAITGFGSLPSTQTCVPDGPFAAYNLSLGPGPYLYPQPHCLTRVFNESITEHLTTAQVANTTRQPDFERFRLELEGRPGTPGAKAHDAGHRVVGGEMADDYSSPGDPVFYLHHASVDRIWWMWQLADAPRRLYEISGRTTTQPPYREVTLDFVLKMGTLVRERDTGTIRDVMDVSRPPLCYTYI